MRTAAPPHPASLRSRSSGCGADRTRRLYCREFQRSAPRAQPGHHALEKHSARGLADPVEAPSKIGYSSKQPIVSVEGTQITTITIETFPPRVGADRNAFLLFTTLVWVGVLSGFGTDSFNHVSKYGLDYPLIVHFHAVAFVGWLVLFTVQVALIRTARADIHRRLGIAGAVLAAMMVVLGPATALVVDAARFTATGVTPEFLAVQFTDILAFAGLTASCSDSVSMICSRAADSTPHISRVSHGRLFSNPPHLCF